ncbi:thioredoxin-like 1-2, chloroplastic [Typha angustifolia]|uniref:thioredoxin-like 1-2, chloroplastic n=1 Tax=Typha angustifolia TaxID=59011 RepID=UPI003C2D7ACF
MLKVLAKGDLFSPCGHRSPGSSCHRRSSSSVGFLRSSSLAIESGRTSSRNSRFYGVKLVLGTSRGNHTKGNTVSSPVQMTLSIGKAMKWWEKGVQVNMKVIESAQDLVDSLLNAGDKLVIVDFFSPGCGGCRSLHPKVCQFAETNPDVLFLQVNYEKHKSMCYSLNVHVLPFFRFYRGAQGRLCSFSCTNATIKKFKDALAKHTPERCSLGPPKGLEESELLALAANKDLCFNYSKKPGLVPSTHELAVPLSTKLPMSPAPRATLDSEEMALLVGSGR